MPDVLNYPNKTEIQEVPRVERSRFAFLQTPRCRQACLVMLGLFILGTAFVGYGYVKLARIVDQRLAEGAFSTTFNIYTAPRPVAVGDPLTVDEVVKGLRDSGYSPSRENRTGWYQPRHNGIDVFPGPDSSSGGEPVRLEIDGGKVSRILSPRDNAERKSFLLEPQLLTNLSDERAKRRLVHFADIPQSLTHALVSIEDKHFFQHAGLDVSRILKAAYVDLREGRKSQGGSTLSMQLARMFWLDPQKNWRRKVEEILLTLRLEEKLSKEQIFEYYANAVYLGRRGTFSISGFGEASRAYFGKELSQISVPEAALLAGIVQRPSYFNPFRYPERTRDRRNLVLNLMRQNGYLSEGEYQSAIASPIALTPERPEGIESQYFVDLMNDELQNRLDEREKRTRSIISTLDPRLQDAAQAAVQMGMQKVDEQLKKKKKAGAIPDGQPQVALVALDPHTGEIKALVGGRNYDTSQLNHALAQRQPGSVFKPFVYAAAVSTAVEGGSRVFTPATVLHDEPQTFAFQGQVYTPANFGHEFMGDVTLRTALAHSLNVATVDLAQRVGYRKIVELAQRAGLNDSIKATPAVALGAYETTPLEIAGAYTMFANHGTHVKPTTLALVRAADGTVIYRREPEQRPALDPRVTYVMVSMMQEVLRSGTGAGVRSRGFTLPAAGKTGTSRDGWFAGFTTELLCVVWVGFDDNRDLKLEGARSALPIWAEFMKRAAQYRQYHDAKPFAAPPGVVNAEICGESGQLAEPNCPQARYEAFISGSQPTESCDLHRIHYDTNVYDRVIIR